jgi:hypothetical protein
MKDARPGEELWDEWDGQGYEFTDLSTTDVYFTFDSVDTDNEIVRRALASSLQRDGLCHSLGDGFKLLDGVKPNYGWVGYLEDEDYLSICDENGETPYGDILDNVRSVTWMELVL